MAKVKDESIEDTFRDIAGYAVLALQQMSPDEPLPKILGELGELIGAKNTDYGDRHARFGLRGIIVRLDDKLGRIETLTGFQPDGPKAFIIDLMEEAVRRQNAKPSVRSDGTLRGPKNAYWAGDFGECKRKVVYKWLGGPKRAIGPQSQRIFDVGDGIHEILQRYLEMSGKALAIEKAFKVPPFSFRIDGIVMDKDGKAVIVEFKSMNTFMFNDVNRIWKNDLSPDKIRELKAADKWCWKVIRKHILQALLYSRVSGIDEAFMVYMDKNRQTMKELRIIASDPKWDEYKKLIDDTIKEVDDDVARARVTGEVTLSLLEDGENVNYCKRYCDYYELCKGLQPLIIDGVNVREKYEKDMAAKGEEVPEQVFPEWKPPKPRKPRKKATKKAKK